MKNKEFLSDAMEHIGDDLLLDAKDFPKPSLLRRRLPMILTAAAACAALVVGCFLMFHGKEPPSIIIEKPPATTNITPITGTSPTTGVPPTVDTWQPSEPVVNLWQREDFSAYSMVYSNSIQIQELSYNGGVSLVFLTNEDSTENPDQVLQSAPIQLPNSSSVRVEAVIANRYVAYLSETGNSIFYDTQEGTIVDLQQRILGDDAISPEALFEMASEMAERTYPGILSTAANRAYFWEYFIAASHKTITPSPYGRNLYTTFIEDLTNLGDLYEYYDGNHYKIFADLCWNSFVYTQEHENYTPSIPYRVKFIAVDAASGKCLVYVVDMVGNVLNKLLFDIASGTLIDADGALFDPLVDYTITYDKENNTLIMTGSPVLYGYSGYSIDYTQRHLYDDKLLTHNHYAGETTYFWNLNDHTILSIRDAASNGFISSGGKVYYSKKIPVNCTGRSFSVPYWIWHNRLTLRNKDTDHWAFMTQNPYWQETVLTGNFIGFMRDETIAVMERDGNYYAYLLGVQPDDQTEPGKDSYESEYFYGKDVTQQIRDGTLLVAPHERLHVFIEGGVLYRQDMFSGEEKQPIIQATQYVLSDNGAFVFAYQSGSDQVMCYNIATLEHCAIALDTQLQQQLQANPKAVFQMKYSESENSLVLSFYLKEDTKTYPNVDFFETLSKKNTNPFGAYIEE